jgi:predicted nucleic acid-binding protein
MGLILDSSVLIAAEREGRNAHQALTQIAVRAAGEDVALSVVTVLELAHGAARADTEQRRATRRQFIHELMAAIPVHPVCCSGSQGRTDRRREHREGCYPATLRPVDRCHRPGAWLPGCNREYAPLPGYPRHLCTYTLSRESAVPCFYANASARISSLRTVRRSTRSSRTS